MLTLSPTRVRWWCKGLCKNNTPVNIDVWKSYLLTFLLASIDGNRKFEFSTLIIFQRYLFQTSKNDVGKKWSALTTRQDSWLIAISCSTSLVWALVLTTDMICWVLNSFRDICQWISSALVGHRLFIFFGMPIDFQIQLNRKHRNAQFSYDRIHRDFYDGVFNLSDKDHLQLNRIRISTSVWYSINIKYNKSKSNGVFCYM